MCRISSIFAANTKKRIIIPQNNNCKGFCILHLGFLNKKHYKQDFIFLNP